MREAQQVTEAVFAINCKEQAGVIRGEQGRVAETKAVRGELE
jgi:hypothetical protein